MHDDVATMRTVRDELPDLSRCSIHHWLPRLRAATIRTTLIPLDAAFVQYLLADGIFVPDVCDGGEDGAGNDDDSGGSGWDDDGDGDSDEAAANRFPELEAKITEAIRKHGGVFSENDADMLMSLRRTQSQDDLAGSVPTGDEDSVAARVRRRREARLLEGIQGGEEDKLKKPQ